MMPPSLPPCDIWSMPIWSTGLMPPMMGYRAAAAAAAFPAALRDCNSTCFRRTLSEPSRSFKVPCDLCRSKRAVLGTASASGPQKLLYTAPAVQRLSYVGALPEDAAGVRCAQGAARLRAWLCTRVLLMLRTTASLAFTVRRVPHHVRQCLHWLFLHMQGDRRSKRVSILCSPP